MKERDFMVEPSVTYILVLMAVIFFTGSSLGEEDQFAAFHKWAVEYAIEQQRASQYKLTDYEDMNLRELYELLSKPWYEKHNALHDQLSENVSNSDEADKIWEQTMADDDELLMQLFRENLHNGHHTEARIYRGLLYFDANEMAAAQEAFEVYIKGYEHMKSQLETFAAEEAVRPYHCLAYNGSSIPSDIYPVSEGVKEEIPSDVTRLYSGPQGPDDWPYFPVMRVNFGLTDGSESPSDNFIKADIRHYDRTDGQSLRNCLDWMFGWGRRVYGKILDENGLESAKEAFRNNLSIESGANFIEFRDNGTQCGVAFYDTKYGTVQMTKHRNFYRRCTPVND